MSYSVQTKNWFSFIWKEHTVYLYHKEGEFPSNYRLYTKEKSYELAKQMADQLIEKTVVYNKTNAVYY
jgi:hypothetical protein